MTMTELAAGTERQQLYDELWSLADEATRKVVFAEVKRLRAINGPLSEEEQERRRQAHRKKYSIPVLRQIIDRARAERQKISYQNIDRSELTRHNVGLALQSDLFDPTDPKDVVRECAQVAALKATPGVFSEPMHRATAGVLKHCADGEQFYLSLLDPAWRDAGQAKLDGWNAGPTTCVHFEDVSPRPELCKGCPHYGKITSPIQVGQMAARQCDREYLRGQYPRLSKADRDYLRDQYRE